MQSYQKNLYKIFGGDNFYLKHGAYATKVKGVEIPGLIFAGGKIPRETMKKLVEGISEITGKDDYEVINNLTRKPGYALEAEEKIREEKGREREKQKSRGELEAAIERIEKLIDGLGVVLFVFLAFLIVMQSNLLTGAAIDSFSNSYGSIGILVCVVALIVLFFYKFRKK